MVEKNKETSLLEWGQKKTAVFLHYHVLNYV